MKITTFLLLIAIMSASAGTYAQKITLSEKNAPLEKVLNKIRIQSGYNILYSTKLIKQGKPVTINLNNASLEEALQACLNDQQLTYNVKEQVVLIKKKEKGFFEKVVDRFQAIDIRAKVTDENGLPLPGASVRVKNSNQAAVTDANGFFNLKGVAEDAILVVSFIGYNQKEVKVSADLGLIKLEAATSKLDEVQVIAYGTTSRRLSTSNISTVKAEDIAKQPVTNVLMALQGRVPGLVIDQATGTVNSGVKVRIQGQNTIRSGTDPLYVIDGVPYPSQLMFGGAVILGESGAPFSQKNAGNIAVGGNPLSFINPATIESVDVLKDADATAIYGSRAANGAILITTKKGKAGQTKVDVTMHTGWGEVGRKMNLLNTQQYLEMRKEAFVNDALPVPTASTTPTYFNYDLTVWDQNRNTDWQKELIGGTAINNNVQASISGGTATTQFLVGAGYHKETTVFVGDFNDRKASMNFSLNNVSTNQKFRVQLNGSYMSDLNRLPNADLTGTAVMMSPNAPSLYNADGSLNWAPYTDPLTGTTVSTWNNPLAFLNKTYKIQTNNLVSNALLSYQILPGLDLKSSFGYNSLQTDEFGATPLSYYMPEIRSTMKNQSRFLNSTMNTWLIEPQLTYKRVIGQGTLDALVGGTFQQNEGKNLAVTAVGFATEQQMEDLASAPANGLFNQTSASSRYRYNAAFGRLSYNWKDKYLVNVNVRRDGSSRFGENNRFHTFGSVAGAWIFSAEDLIKDKLSFLSFGKIRGSYGTTGNDQIGEYEYLNRYTPDQVNGPIAYQGASALALAGSGLADSRLAWEETKKLQFGLDLGFFKDRVLINTNYYRNRTSNQLLTYNLPYLTGTSSILTNFPATVQNNGWEFSLNSTNLRTKNFSWSTSFNLSLPKNKLLAFPDLENSPYARSLIVGLSVTNSQFIHFLGADPATGLFQYADKDSKPTSSPKFPADATVYMDLGSPKFYGGFQNTFSYKGFQLDALFQFKKQKGQNVDRGYQAGMFVSNQAVLGNQPISVLDRWQKAGDVTDIQRFSNYMQPGFTMPGLQALLAYYAALGTDAGAITDASYIRLKNVSLSWQLPEGWASRARLKNARLFMQGQNLLTFTHYKGMDPESSGATFNFTTLPPLRVWTFGLQLGL